MDYRIEQQAPGDWRIVQAGGPAEPEIYASCMAAWRALLGPPAAAVRAHWDVEAADLPPKIRRTFVALRDARLGAAGEYPLSANDLQDLNLTGPSSTPWRSTCARRSAPRS